METRCVRIQLKADVLDKVRAWAREVTTRETEAQKILKAEGVLIESAFLDEVGGEHYLIYFMKAENRTKSPPSATLVPGSLGAYHHQFKKECWQSVHPLEQLIDLDLMHH